MVKFFLMLALLVMLFGCGVQPIAFYFLVAVVLVVIQVRLPVLNRKVSSGILLGASSVLITLLFAEFLTRVFMAEAVFGSPFLRLLEYSPYIRGQDRLRPNSDLDMTVVGDLARMIGAGAGSPRREHLITDEFGYRNLPDALKHPVSIIALGDSYGLGTGEQGALWPSVLERTLKKRVYNLSFPGSPADELARLVSIVPQLKLQPGARVLWMLFTGNDLAEGYGALQFSNQDRQLGIFGQIAALVANQQLRSPLNLLVAAVMRPPSESRVFESKIDGIGKALFYRPYEQAAQSQRPDLDNPGTWSDLVRTVELMKDFVHQHRLNLTVFIAPSKEKIYLTPHNISELSAFASALDKTCLRLDLQCVDMERTFAAAAFPAKSAPQLLWWVDDTHWNNEGNFVAAAEIAKVLDSDE